MAIEGSCVFLMLFQEYLSLDTDSPESFNWRTFRISILQKYAIQKMQLKN